METAGKVITTLILMCFDLAGRILSAVFQFGFIFLLGASSSDGPGGEDDSPWWDNAFDLDDDDPKLSHGIIHVPGVSDSTTDPEGLYRPYR